VGTLLQLIVPRRTHTQTLICTEYLRYFGDFILFWLEKKTNTRGLKKRLQGQWRYVADDASKLENN